MRKCMELVAESMTDNLSLLELTKLIQILLRGEGFDVNLQHPKTGTSALHIASREGGVDLVGDLLARGAKLEGTDFNGATALHLARSREVAELLVSHSGSEACTTPDKGGNPPLVYAIVNRRDDVREFLIENGAGPAFFNYVQMVSQDMTKKLNQGLSTPVTEVAMPLTVEALIKLVEKEAELYPKLLAPANLIEACRGGSMWGARTAIARAEDVNQRDDREAAKLLLPGYTALHWAAAIGHFGCVQALLASDEIDLNPTDTEDDDGYTPLQVCINYRQADWEKCVRLMRARGAKVRVSGDTESNEESDYAESSIHRTGSSEMMARSSSSGRLRARRPDPQGQPKGLLGGMSAMFSKQLPGTFGGGSSSKLVRSSKIVSRRGGADSRLSRGASRRQ